MTGSTVSTDTTRITALPSRANTTRRLEWSDSARSSRASSRLPAQSDTRTVARIQNTVSSAVIRENFCLPMEILMPSSNSWISGSTPVRCRATAAQTSTAIARSQTARPPGENASRSR